mmetsp:Transcript_115928/g.322817  ORF Transcript_115928/g.322817 Transcript_115928/m.322817 type:complete len:207 (-) Transcript_115928:343-963(-)
MPIMPLGLRVVLCHLDPGGAVNACTRFLGEFLSVTYSEAHAQDPRQAILCCAVVSHGPTSVVLLEPAVVTFVVLAFHIDGETLPTKGKLVGLAAPKELAPVVLEPAEVLVEAEVEHLLRRVLHLHTCRLQCSLEGLKEVGAAEPVALPDLPLQAPRPAASYLARHLDEVHQPVPLHQVDLGQVGPRAGLATPLCLAVNRPVAVELD